MNAFPGRRVELHSAARWRTAVLLGCALALMGGCQEVHESRHPRARHRAVFAPGKTALVVGMELADELEVVMPDPAPITGYVWEVVANNTRVLEQERQPSGRAAGAMFSFFALKPGRSLIRFVLIRPEETEAITLAHCEVLVNVAPP
jgi:hypothetical protein